MGNKLGVKRQRDLNSSQYLATNIRAHSTHTNTVKAETDNYTTHYQTEVVTPKPHGDHSGLTQILVILETILRHSFNFSHRASLKR